MAAALTAEEFAAGLVPGAGVEAAVRQGAAAVVGRMVAQMNAELDALWHNVRVTGHPPALSASIVHKARLNPAYSPEHHALFRDLIQAGTREEFERRHFVVHVDVTHLDAVSIVTLSLAWPVK